jgi:transglutaminase-like putative cysteine protease
LDRRGFDLLCLTMAILLAVHASHLPVWLSAVLALVLGARWWQRRRYGGRVPWWLKLAPTLLLPLVVIGTYGSIFGRAPGSALAVGLLVLKLLESEKPRDARTGIAFACFGLMSALLFDQGLVATVVVALGLVPALATLRALEPQPAALPWTHDLWPVARALGLALPLALAAFLFVPRLSEPLWGAPNAQQARTGVSGRMSPGDFTELLIDDRPAFRVAFDAAPPPPAERYFRGPVLWQFDGRAWDTGGHGAAATLRKAAPEPMRATGTIYDYDVTLEPTRRHWLFGLDTPLAAPPGAWLSAERSVLRVKSIDAALHYRLRSAPRRVLAMQLDDRDRRRGLQLPDGFDPRARALASDWRRQYGDNDGAIVQAALRLFHDGGFSYTLAPPPLGRDSVDDFLFSTRQGFCEHYASAFTFLMRAAGIPARVVTGYQGGYWNALGDYLLVRQSDAHAWSEVWLRGRGWTRIDPTAAVRPERVSLGAAAAADGGGAWYQNGWLQGLRNHWDIVNRWWSQGVIGFDALRQRGLLTPFGVRRADTAALAIALAISIGLLVALGLAGTLLRQRRGDALETSMALLLQRLARLGVARRASEGPRHFFTRAARALPHERHRLHALGEAYLMLRYATEAPAPESLRAFRRAVREFRPRRMVK